MRILHIGCSYLPYPGGGTVRLRRLVENYAGGGVDLFLATHTPSGDPADDAPFARVLRDPAVNSLMPNKNLANFVREVEPELVVVHNSRILMAWLLFYKRQFPDVRVVCEIHSVRENSRVHSWLNRQLYRRCDGVVVLSEAMKSHLQHGLKKRSPRIQVIYSGVEVSETSPASDAKNGYDPVSAHYAYVGSFYDWQGVLVLADAVQAVGVDFWTRNRLTLVGSGPEFDAVKSVMGQDILALDTVRLLGWRPLEEIAAIMSDVDFLMAPRISNLATELTVPLKVFESIQYKLPLIAARVGGLTELLDAHRPAAFFVEPGSVESLVEQLRNPPSADDYTEIQRRLGAMMEILPKWRNSAQKYVTIMHEIIYSQGQKS